MMKELILSFWKDCTNKDCQHGVASVKIGAMDSYDFMTLFSCKKHMMIVAQAWESNDI